LSGVYEYAVSPHAVRIDRDSVTLVHPFRSRRIRFAEVTGIDIEDEFHKGRRLPRVRLRTRDRPKGYVLPPIGVDTTTLHTALRQAWEASAP